MDFSLRGYTIGITADRRWQEQASLFERRGATVLHGPSIRTIPLEEDDQLRRATEAVIERPVDALIANTGIGIRSWFAAAESWNMGDQLVASLASTQVYARGPKASGAIHSAGLEVASRPSSERLADAVDAALSSLRAGQRLALQVDGSGMSAEVDRILDAGVEVIIVPSYLWRSPQDERPALRLAEAVITGRVHAVTFTAGPAVRNWLRIAAGHGLEGDLRRALTEGPTVIGSVGPVCTSVLRSLGLASSHLVEPSAARLGPLVRAVEARLADQVVRVDVSGVEVAIHGTLVTFPDGEVQLTDTEARLLWVLAAQPDVVFTKDHLLKRAWTKPTADEHAVEMGIARLRRKLGPHGRAILSVHRRGYAIRTGKADS